MKKFFLLTLVALMSTMVWAAPRSMQQARSMAPGLRHVRTALTTNGQPAFYIFNRDNDEGFVIISADDRAHTVLAYSDKGHWDENDLPENLRVWLEGYAEQIGSQDAFYAPSMETASYTPVGQLCQTTWGQNDPYNRLCPMWQSSRTVTGCVATAASQIMKKHNYPEHGIGSHSYKWANANGDSIVLSADFENTTYDWSNMLNSYTSSATDVQKDAVATLIYHCGVANEMRYGKSASTGDSPDMLGQMIDYFDYDKGIRTYRKGYAPDSVIMENIYNNLRMGQPVYISAKTIDSIGHAFVCDGIDADGLLHINWGWNGKADGYYQLSAFAPKEQGTGGSSSGKAFTERIKVFTHIRPNADGDYYYSFSCERIQSLQPAYHRDSVVRFRVDSFYNDSYHAWEGHLRLILYQNGAYYGSRSTSTDMKPLQPGKRRNMITYSANFSDRTKYPDGEYDLVIAARATDQGTKSVIPVWCKGYGEWRCKMTFEGDSIYIDAPQRPEGILNTSAETVEKAQKILRDGVLYIRRNGVTYNVQGIKVND